MIFIGTVIDRESQWDPSPYEGITSLMTLEVERVIHGPVPEVIDVWIQGGKVGKTILRVSDEPTGKVGTRYFLALYTTPRKRGAWGKANQDPTGAEDWSAVTPDIEHRFRILLYYVLNPDVDLPPEQTLAAMWNEHCMQSKRYGRTERPTQEYLHFVPPYLLRLCRHYRTPRDDP